MLEQVVDATARQFARAIVMPNLVPPVTTVAAGAAYRERILAAVSPELDFTPLMTAYLTDEIDPEEIARGHAEGVFTACKLYPANATTNSAAGVTDVANIARVLERMQAIGMPLLIHGEVTSPEVDIFDREAVFIDQILAPLRCDFPELKVVLEHITTRDAVQYVEAGDDCLAATITAHHLRIDRNDLLVGGMRPHNYCLPIAKRALHKEALRGALRPAAKSSSWARTLRPIRRARRKAPAAAPASTAPLSRWRAMPRPSKSSGHSRISKASRVNTGRASTACL